VDIHRLLTTQAQSFGLEEPDMLRRFALTMLLATTTSVLVANQPGEARRNRFEAVIPPLPALQVAAAAVAADEIDEQAQVVELAASVPPANASWSVAVTIDERTRCALGPSVECLANDTRLRAAGILLDPDDPADTASAPALAPAAPHAAPAPAARPEQPPAPRPAPHEVAAPPRPRAAALRAFTPEFVPVPAPARAPSQRRDAEGSGVVAPMQWRIAPAAWLDLRPRTELTLARGQANRVPSEPLDGGPPIPGNARLRVGISVPLEALRAHASKPLGEAAPPPGVARLP
jgi:hypothetical protein